jgi:hypothetical protein
LPQSGVKWRQIVTKRGKAAKMGGKTRLNAVKPRILAAKTQQSRKPPRFIA